MEILISCEIREMTPSAPDTAGIEGQMLRSKGYRIGARIRRQLTREVGGGFGAAPSSWRKSGKHSRNVGKDKVEITRQGRMRPSASASLQERTR